MADTTGGQMPAMAVQDGSYVEWSAVLAGAVVALAITFVLLTFGSAVGLSAVSPWTSTERTVTSVSIGAGFWMLLVHIWAFACGGYISGRMRYRWNDSTQNEAEFRDDAHGLLVWAAAVTFGATIAAMTLISTGQSVVQGAATAAGNNASTITQTAVDTMFRAAARPAAPNAPVDDTRGEATRILTRSAAAGEVTQADRTYLTQLVSARTGLPQPEAEKRVNDTIAQATDATNKARKTGIMLGFITAATLLVGAVAAWWGAGMGGKHRDEGHVWEVFSRSSTQRFSGFKF
jgi:hypothetical protein